MAKSLCVRVCMCRIHTTNKRTKSPKHLIIYTFVLSQSENFSPTSILIYYEMMLFISHQCLLNSKISKSNCERKQIFLFQKIQLHELSLLTKMYNNLTGSKVFMSAVVKVHISPSCLVELLKQA